MASDVMIHMDGVWKRYGLGIGRALRRASRVLWARNDSDSLTDDGSWALRDINLEVRRGETLGIIGRNGAGKSTLLKILAGVTLPTRGKVMVQGRVFPMIELNAGLHMELTGRENVFLLGAIMGLPRQGVKNKMSDIEEFCELEDFFDRPVRIYSSGMLARLGFGVAMNVDADIFLFDEILAVGDVAFQKKCLEKMNEICDYGATLIIVSHNPYLIERTCSRAILIDRGQIKQIGMPSDVMVSYFESIVRTTSSVDGMSLPRVLPYDIRQGTGQIRLERVQILTESGQQVSEIETLQSVIFRLHLKVNEPTEKPHISIRIFDPSNTMVAMFQASPGARNSFNFEQDSYLDCVVDNLPLMPNVYSVGVKIGGGDLLIDHVAHAASFTMRGSRDVFLDTGNSGLLYVPRTWRFSAAMEDSK
jgi:ABC-type polysaccharide/polyol phosphate transport system ATPase subunit